MSSTVWRYVLEARTRQEIEMPWGARILRFAPYKGGVCIWALVDPQQTAMKKHEFLLHATGEEIQDAADLYYIGTVIGEGADGKSQVVHCFEVLRIVV